MSVVPSAAGAVRRVVVLGHSGFIGRRLIEAFRQRRPDLDVVGSSAPSVDLTDPVQAAALAPLFDRDTIVVMCSGIKKQRGDTHETFERNVAMAVNVGRVLRQRPVHRLVFFSSADVYGEGTHDEAITETTAVRPTSFYGMAKHASERLLAKVVAAQPGGSLLVVRPPLVYGPGDDSRGYGPAGFVWSALRGDTLVLWGDGSERREFLFLDDLVDRVYALAFHDYAGVVNVVNARSHSFAEIVDIVRSLGQGACAVESRLRTPRKVDQGYDDELLRRLLPAASLTPLAEGVRRTYAAESAVAKEGALHG